MSDPPETWSLRKYKRKLLNLNQTSLTKHLRKVENQKKSPFRVQSHIRSDLEAWNQMMEGQFGSRASNVNYKNRFKLNHAHFDFQSRRL